MAAASWLTASFTGTDVNFIGNAVNNGYDGGGLYVSGAVKLTGGQFVNNQTTRSKGYGGGGGLISFGLADISGTLFSGNTSSDWGGGAYLAYFANNAPSVLTNVHFISNTANSGGGGGSSFLKRSIAEIRCDAQTRRKSVIV